MLMERLDEPAHHDEPLPADVPEVMRFAELYPGIAFGAAGKEVLQAQSAVALGAHDRIEIINRMVTARLASYDGEGHHRNDLDL
jgi:hypothetical protein